MKNKIKDFEKKWRKEFIRKLKERLKLNKGCGEKTINMGLAGEELVK